MSLPRNIVAASIDVICRRYIQSSSLHPSAYVLRRMQLARVLASQSLEVRQTKLVWVSRQGLASRTSFDLRVFELRILSVGEIQKLLIVKLDILRLSSNLSLLVVLRSRIKVDKHYIDQTDALQEQSV